MDTKYKQENEDEKERFINKSSTTSAVAAGPRKQSHHRIIKKNGECNIFHRPKSSLSSSHLYRHHQHQQFIFDFSKLVDASWTTTLSIFLVTLLSSWLLFAIIWWLICYSHGDFEPAHLPAHQTRNNHKPCVRHIESFVSCFLFSIETQHTVGYGIKAPTEECPEAIFVNIVQCIIGFIMQGFMAVIIFAKMTLPRLRSGTLLFSRHAVISSRHHQQNNDDNDELCLMFRIGDMRKNHIIDARIRAYFVRTQKTVEGELLNHQTTALPLKVDNYCCRKSSLELILLFFNWPLIISHKIDVTSPLYQFVSPELGTIYINDSHRRRFEIVVLLEGTMQSTGQKTQARTSYVAQEILWDQQFEPVLSFDYDRNEYQVDFSKFDQLLPVVGNRTPPGDDKRLINKGNLL